MKIKYMTSVMTASRTSNNLTYASWLRLFDKENGSSNAYLMESFLVYWLSYSIKWPTGPSKPLYVLSNHFDLERDLIRTSPALPRVFVHSTGRVCQQCGPVLDKQDVVTHINLCFL